MLHCNFSWPNSESTYCKCHFFGGARVTVSRSNRTALYRLLNLVWLLKLVLMSVLSPLKINQRLATVHWSGPETSYWEQELIFNYIIMGKQSRSAVTIWEEWGRTSWHWLRYATCSGWRAKRNRTFILTTVLACLIRHGMSTVDLW